jgi:hypothetical protein
MRSLNNCLAIKEVGLCGIIKPDVFRKAEFFRSPKCGQSAWADIFSTSKSPKISNIVSIYKSIMVLLNNDFPYNT